MASTLPKGRPALKPAVWAHICINIVLIHDLQIKLLSLLLLVRTPNKTTCSLGPLGC